jgi:tetratricopeptide (TPR) repeat protein
VRPALADNALAAGRLDPLDAGEVTDLAGMVVEPLFTAWGGTTANRRRNLGLDLQLTRVALHADDAQVTATWAAGAVEALRAGPAVDAFRLGQEAITLLDRHQRPVSIFLLRRVADAATTSGDGDTAGQLFTRAIRQAQTDDPDQTDSLDRARVTAEHATYLINRGELHQAEQLLQQAHQLFTTAGSEQEATACQGTIADILYQRGDYDDAAVLQTKRLDVSERMGDLDGMASAKWGLAQIDVA